MKARSIVASVALLLYSGLLQQAAWSGESDLSFRFLNPATSRVKELTQYQLWLKTAIGAKFQPVALEGVRTDAEVLFQIRPDGTLLNAAVTRSSGNPEFDKQALAAIRQSLPLREPPLGDVRLLNVVARFGAIRDGAKQNGVESKALDDSSAPAIPSAQSTPATTETKTATEFSDASSTLASPTIDHHEHSDESRLIHAGVDKRVLTSGDSMRILDEGVGAGLTAQSAEEDKTPLPLSSVIQSKKPIELSASHGYAAVGVLGFEWEIISGRIIRIFPGCDLLRFGITEGDRIVSEDGMRIGFSSPSRMRGAPGTFVQITVQHNGQLINAQVQRKDAADFAQYHVYYKHWANKGVSW